MARALRLVVAACLVFPLLILAPTSRAQAQTEAASYIDAALQDALTEVDLVDAWVSSSEVSAEASLVEVLGDADYELARQTLLDDLRNLAERRAHIDDRAAQARSITADVATLDALARELRREVSESGRSAAVSLTPSMVAEAQLTLEAVVGERRWIGISLDVLALAEHRVVQSRDTIARQIENLSDRQSSTNKTLDHAIATFTDVAADLQRVQALVDRSVQRSLAVEFAYAAEQAQVEETMSALHEMRLVSPTAVGGLTLVTVDAYVRGAAALDASCPVDWALLAGIGRVESRHGTIDNTVVSRSGQVSQPIFGPLLDGGATEREAAQAADDAAAAVEAEEALRQAEAQAEAEAAAAEQAALEALVWGEAAEERAKELEERTAPPEPVGLAATPEPVVEEPAPRYDPLLWGDDLPFDEDDFPASEETEDTGDEEEPEFRGNGFAVIADSDDGRLDGNARWDRAVGPMQFIPETWSYWETDGNNDGAIDPQNLYDAAATAGQFLCHLSRTRGSSPSSFVLGYNSSQTYVRNVLAVAGAFRDGELPTVSGADS